MVDEATYERELGGINTQLKYLSAGQDKIFERLDDLTSDGCARGKRNTQDIEDLRKQPSRIISIGAAVIAALAAVFSWVHGR